MSSQPPSRPPSGSPETIRIGRSRAQQQADAAQPAIVINRPSPSVRINSSLLRQAKENDAQAIATMFKQFAPDDESIFFAEYLGVEGLWGLGTHSFACLTNKRIAAIRVGLMGEVVYQDGYLEFLNSGIVYQPSKLMLYLMAGVISLFTLFSLTTAISGATQAGSGISLLVAVLAVPVIIGVALLVLMFCVRLYYRLHKCGLVWIVREGVSIYVFTNRKLLTRANHLYRLCAQQREKRYAELLHVV